MNLWALAYRAGYARNRAGCQCFTCRHHSRAYIHHLLQAHEMAARVLLERLSSLFRLFRRRGDAIGAGKFDAFAAFHRRRAANAASK